MKGLTHIDEKGKARMVDVSGKEATLREAHAQGSVVMKKKTLGLIQGNKIQKGNVLGTARIAGIMGAKKTSEAIPLCHPLNITAVDVDFRIDQKNNRVIIDAKVRTTGPTGVEMEALHAVAMAALTVYDMCKAVDREMVIADIMLLEKKGGKSGHFRR